MGAEAHVIPSGWVVELQKERNIIFSAKATDGGPPTLANHCWTPSIRCARPHGLELSAAHSRTQIHTAGPDATKCRVASRRRRRSNWTQTELSCISEMNATVRIYAVLLQWPSLPVGRNIVMHGEVRQVSRLVPLFDASLERLPPCSRSTESMISDQRPCSHKTWSLNHTAGMLWCRPLIPDL